MRRNCTKFIFTLIFILLPSLGLASDSLREACDFFYKRLEPIPHYSLEVREGKLKSLSTGADFFGCEAAFKSNVKLMKDSTYLPSFEAEEGSELYKEGWRIDEKYRADGPGSGSYGIVKGKMACVIHWDQFSYVDDNGEIQVSDEINMTVQCMELGHWD